jgi:hydrogenase expression/formation protein HypE
MNDDHSIPRSDAAPAAPAAQAAAPAARKVRTGYVRPIDFRHGRVDMTHGSGGRAMAQLIDELFARAFDNEWLRQGNDQAAFAAPAGRMVMATDSHVVSPLFFPGGDIGCLSVHGTINDVAMAGATPLYLAAGFVLEEGFPLADLKRIVESMAAAAREAGVPVVTGDTKVVEKGKGDGVFITTTGVGVVPAGVELSGDRARPGDAILVSGMLGDHGVAIMSLRENLSFETTIESDTAALHGLVAAMLPAAPGLRALRDPTRGGLATTLNELARQSGCGMIIREAAVPVRPQVAAACEFLGLDPLYVANEGKLVAICAPEDAAPLLAAMRAHPLGRDAAIIGSCIEDPHHFVQMDTSFGGRRVVDWLTGEQLPRIC